MKINISKKDVLWNYAGTIFLMGMNYLLLPFLLIYLDEDNLGLWYILMSLSGIANLFVFGFSPSFARNIAYCWNGAEKLTSKGKTEESLNKTVNWQLFYTLMKTCRWIYLLIALTAVLSLGAIGSIYLQIVAGYMMGTMHYLAWVVFLAAIFLNLLYGYYVSVLGGIGKIAEKNRAQVIAGIIRVIATGVLMFAGLGILGACIAYLLYGIVFRMLCKHYFEKSIPDFAAEEKNIEVGRSDIKECFHTIWPNTWRDGMVSISDYLCTQAGTIVCSFFLPLAQTGVYSITVQLVTAIAKLARSFQIAYIPALQSAYITDDTQEAKEVHSMCMVMYVLVYVLGIGGMLIVGIPLVTLIKPSTALDRTVLLGVAVSQFLVVWRNCYASYLSTTNRVEYWRGFIISGLGAVIGAAFLLTFWKPSVWGIIWAAIAVELAYNAWRWTIQVHRELHLGGFEMFMLGIKRLKKMLKGKNQEVA